MAFSYSTSFKVRLRTYIRINVECNPKVVELFYLNRSVLVYPLFTNFRLSEILCLAQYSAFFSAVLLLFFAFLLFLNESQIEETIFEH